jgi:hypothetical protein
MNKSLLHDKAREAFERELGRIKESLSKSTEQGQTSIILESMSDDGVHELRAKKALVESQNRLYKTKERHEKGLKGKGGM